MHCPYRLAFTLFLIQNAFGQNSTETDESDSLESSLNDIANAFSTAGIVPGLIPSFRPSAKLSIQYSMAGEPFTLLDGETVPNALTENEPRLSLTANGTNSRPTGSFIALLVDPKGPTEEDSTETRQVLHYLKHDLAATAASAYLNGNTQPLARYQRLAPYGDEPHQFVFLIYQQPSDFGEKAPDSINNDMDRSAFNLTGFTRQFNLSSPVAGNFFLVQPDPDAKPPSTSSSSSTVSRPSLTNIPTLTPLFGAANHVKAQLGSVVAISMAAVAILSL